MITIKDFFNLPDIIDCYNISGLERKAGLKPGRLKKYLQSGSNFRDLPEKEVFAVQNLLKQIEISRQRTKINNT